MERKKLIERLKMDLTYFNKSGLVEIIMSKAEARLFLELLEKDEERRSEICVCKEPLQIHEHDTECSICNKPFKSRFNN